MKRAAWSRGPAGSSPGRGLSAPGLGLREAVSPTAITPPGRVGVGRRDPLPPAPLPACPRCLRQQRPPMAAGGSAAQRAPPAFLVSDLPGGWKGPDPRPTAPGPRPQARTARAGTPAGPGGAAVGQGLPHAVGHCGLGEGWPWRAAWEGRASGKRCLRSPSGRGGGRWRLAQNLLRKEGCRDAGRQSPPHPPPRNEVDLTGEQAGPGVRLQEGLPRRTGSSGVGRSVPPLRAVGPSAELGRGRGHLPQRRGLPASFRENSRAKHGPQLARKGAGGEEAGWPSTLDLSLCPCDKSPTRAKEVWRLRVSCPKLRPADASLWG